MKIFFTASYYGKEKYQKYYDMVLASLEKLNVEVVSPEKENYLDLLTKRDIKRLKGDRRIHYEAIRKGILWADAVVIEISNEDFQLGHEATLTIQNKKHVLCLSLNEDFSEKIHNKFFHAAKYNQFNIEEIVEKFVRMVSTKRLDQRFNLFLSSDQLKYLEKASQENNVNKSEYIRTLIDKAKERLVS
jgi:hypothetical protein